MFRKVSRGYETLNLVKHLNFVRKNLVFQILRTKNLRSQSPLEIWIFVFRKLNRQLFKGSSQSRLFKKSDLKIIANELTELAFLEAIRR